MEQGQGFLRRAGDHLREMEETPDPGASVQVETSRLPRVSQSTTHNEIDRCLLSMYYVQVPCEAVV